MESKKEIGYYGLVGEKLAHSYSKEIHEQVFKNLGINASYKLFEVDSENIHKLGDFLKILKVNGINVTIPYKEIVMDFLDEISEEARGIGAVNTILNKNNTLIGYNTDYYGFKYMLMKNDIDVENKIAVILGFGGASKAVIKYFKDAKAKKIYVVSRNARDKKVEEKDIELITYEELKDIKGYVLVNATPLGMYPKIDASPVGKEVIENFQCIVDLIYNPLKTKFIKMGEALEKNTCSGLMMLVAQGIKADELWLEKVIENSVIENIYNKLEENFK